MRFRLIALGCLLFSAVALAVAQGAGSVSRVNDPKPQHFLNGFFVGNDTKNPLSNTKNKQAYHLCGTIDWDFPALGNIMAPGTTACAESAALTISGCTFGDRVVLGIDQTRINAFGQIDAYQATATTFKVVSCANGITDGGSFDQPDSGFTICCDGN